MKASNNSSCTANSLQVHLFRFSHQGTIYIPIDLHIMPVPLKILWIMSQRKNLIKCQRDSRTPVPSTSTMNKQGPTSVSLRHKIIQHHMSDFTSHETPPIKQLFNIIKHIRPYCSIKRRFMQGKPPSKIINTVRYSEGICQPYRDEFNRFNNTHDMDIHEE